MGFDFSKILDPAIAPMVALGSQGPDLFYHSQHTRPVAIEYGTLIHRRDFGILATKLLSLALEAGEKEGQGADSSLGESVIECRGRRLLSEEGLYALSFATHAFLDRATHPYIVNRAGWVSPARPETERYARCHAFFERIIDVLMLRYLRGRGQDSWDQETLLARPCGTASENVITLINTALVAAYPKRAAPDLRLRQRIQNAFKDAEGFYRNTDPRKTSLNLRLKDECVYFRDHQDRSSVALVYPEAFPLGIDYLNLSRSPWRHPCGEGVFDIRSFPELYQGAIANAMGYFEALLNHYLKTGKIMDDSPFWLGNGNLSIQDVSGRPCAPLWSEPLPLDQVLTEQYQRRLAYMNHCGL
jgi:hypothetical protein